MESILIKPKTQKDLNFLQEMLRALNKVKSIDLLDEKMVEELEYQALGRAIKVNRKNDFVSKEQIISKLK